MRAMNRNSKGLFITGALIAILLSSGLFGQTLSPPAPKYLIKIADQTMDLSSSTGMTASDCVVITPNGRFHMERRFQRLPNPYASLHIYEASLGRARLAELKALIDSQGVKELPAFTPPQIPMSIAVFRTFIIEVSRGSSVQNAGFFTWQPESNAPPDISPQSTPNSIKKAWVTSERSLMPLAEWFGTVKTLKFRQVSNSKSTLCETRTNRD